MTDEEQYIHECLRRLQEQYYKDAEPYMKRLAQLKYLESPTLLIDANTWALLHPSEITGGSTEMTDTPLFTAPQAQQPQLLTDEEIREIYLSNGFTVKEGQSDLKPYVFASARAVETAALKRMGW